MELFCWSENADPPERDIIVSGFIKVQFVRLQGRSVIPHKGAGFGRANARFSVPSVAGGRARAIVGGGGRSPAGVRNQGRTRVTTAGESGSMGDSKSAAVFDS